MPGHDLYKIKPVSILPWHGKELMIPNLTKEPWTVDSFSGKERKSSFFKDVWLLRGLSLAVHGPTRKSMGNGLLSKQRKKRGHKTEGVKEGRNLSGRS